ncbi:MAG: YoaK family protein [Bdellovibrionota bacterium]
MSTHSSPRRLPIYWWTLSFQAGAINAGGFLSCGQNVSHVTGFLTQVGTLGAQNRWNLALGLLSVPIFFLLGAIATTIILEHPRSYARDRFYGYSIVLGIVALLCLSVAVLGWWHSFGSFNESLDLRRHYMLLVMLSLACGFQNALFSDRAGTVIRSTHMTGPTTDLGIEIGRLFLVAIKRAQRLPEIKFRRELTFSLIRGISILLFIGGALMGSFFFLRYQYLGFLVPSFTAIVLFYDSFKAQRRLFFD